MMSPRILYRSFGLALAAGTILSRAGLAQISMNGPGAFSTLNTVSGDSSDRVRLTQLDRRLPDARYLLKSTSSLMSDPRDSLHRLDFRWVLPSVTIVSNSALPSGENNGALWAGRGPNARLMAGFDAAFGSMRLTVIPEFAYASNEFFEYTQLYAPSLPPSRNPYASPWNVYPYSVDAPPRMGPGHMKRLGPGQSTLSVRARGLDFGVTTENEWWGPGVRTAIVLGDNAEGFPRAYVKPQSLLHTRAGTFDFRLTWGGLSESPYFDHDAGNDLRYWSAFAGTWTPNLEPDLTLGFARAVFNTASDWFDVAIRPLGFVAPSGHPNARTLTDTAFIAGRDQIFSLFGQWVFPGKGFEAYAEWARAELPTSLRDLLVDPGHSQAYTFGLQWLGRPSRWGRPRIQAEHSNLEQDPSFVNRPLGSFYSSRSVIQGYTNRGQVLGAGMGQGSSGQWIATDLIAPKYSVGAFVTRTRFNNDAYFLLPFAYNHGHCEHDVTAGPGARASLRTRFGGISALYASVQRMNPFFQNQSGCESVRNVINVRNHTFSLTFTATR